MKVELNKKGLAALVIGIDSIHKTHHPEVATLGAYYGGLINKWMWNPNFEEKMTEEQLWELYQILTK